MTHLDYNVPEFVYKCC